MGLVYCAHFQMKVCRNRLPLTRYLTISLWIFFSIYIRHVVFKIVFKYKSCISCQTVPVMEIHARITYIICLWFTNEYSRTSQKENCNALLITVTVKLSVMSNVVRISHEILQHKMHDVCGSLA